MRESKYFVTALLLFVTVFSQSVALWAQSVPEKDGTYSVRHRDTPPGIYESSYSNPLRGIQRSDLTEEGIRAYFASHPELQAEEKFFDLSTGDEVTADDAARSPDQVRRQVDRKILYVVGVPMMGKERAETLEIVQELVGKKTGGLKTWLRNLFYLDKQNPEVHLRPISRPGGKWKVIQNFLYPIPYATDLAPVSREVMKQGIQSVTISASIGLAIQLFVQFGEQGEPSKALAIVVPAWIINSMQSAWTSLPRNWWQNYFRRAEHVAAPVVEPFLGRGRIPDKVSRVLGSIAQQIWMTTLFTMNVFIAGQGSVEKAVSYMSIPGIWEIIKKKANSMVLNIFWRTPVENSLADYAESEAALKRGSAADREAAKIRKWITILSTNLWVYSTLTHMNWEYLGYKWNFGHLGMALVGVFGISAWISPKIYRRFTKTGRDFNKCQRAIQNLGG